ncbi:hypothetical protein KM043_005237 [Ampulex compressa]|nr:hypothetical protein KM043_005237 [Ampulex compressa]
MLFSGTRVTLLACAMYCKKESGSELEAAQIGEDPRFGRCSAFRLGLFLIRAPTVHSILLVSRKIVKLRPPILESGEISFARSRARNVRYTDHPRIDVLTLPDGWYLEKNPVVYLP